MNHLVVTHNKSLWRHTTDFNSMNSHLTVVEAVHNWMVENLDGYYWIEYDSKWHDEAVHITWGKAAIILYFTSERDAVLFKTFWL